MVVHTPVNLGPMQTSDRRLIVITGPVGGGKSSTGIGLAHALQQRSSRLVAVIDLDHVYEFVRQTVDADDEAAWQRARAGAAALSNTFFDSGVSVVVVEGEFFMAKELDALLAPIPASVRRDIFTLKVSYPQAWTRVQGDPSRGMSKNAAFLQSMLVKFEQALPFLTCASTIIEADAPALDDVVRELIARIAPGEIAVP
jgi:hypothetical protein